MTELNETAKQENLNAFEKLLDQQVHKDKSDQSRYRYFQDLYNNQYRWTTHRQEDGKFHATMLKSKVSRGWISFTTKKTKYFGRRKSAKSWCLKQYLRAKGHQDEVFARRAKRKEEREALKPKFTKEQLTSIDLHKKIEHYEQLSKRTMTKIKTNTTRLKKYEKRIKHCQKRLARIAAPQIPQ